MLCRRVIARIQQKGDCMSNEVYRTWRQDADRFNQAEAWREELFPRAEYRYMKEAGCLITSLAIMLRRYGFETEADEVRFNPFILNERLIAAGAFDDAADLYLKHINKLYPLDYIGSMGYTCERAQMLYKRGNPFLITVPGTLAQKHFVVFDGICTDGDIAVIDPAGDKTRISQFDKVLELRVFRKHKAREESRSVFPDLESRFVRSEVPGEDLAAAALAQEGKTGLALGYDYDWCAAFISDLAVLIAQEQAIPWESFVSELRLSLLAAGGKRIETTPLPGDIAFINRKGGDSPNHVEIVFDTDKDGAILSVGGNSGEDSSTPLVSCVCRHRNLDCIKEIIRPAYR